MLDVDTHMAAEIREAPEAVARQARALGAPLADLVVRLRRHPPQVVVTCARGSSAHAATFGKLLIERYGRGDLPAGEATAPAGWR